MTQLSDTVDVKDKLLEISDKIKKLKFKKRIIGGIDNLDVWYKLSQIDKEYQSIIEAQRQMYEDKINQLKIELESIKQSEREIT